ncbi:hypothetical protein [Actinophytocola sp.]|uniref:hypothetical protein n=1 Tax=Actinophytocola sp. TaxID=1872138 RepID=UPI002ED32AAD
MSLFGPVDDGDLRGWQQRGVKALAALVKLAAREELPPLNWSLTSSGALASAHHPRAVFESWAVLDSHHRVEPQRSRLAGRANPTQSERTTRDGRLRLFAGYTFRLSDRLYPSTDLAVIAEWWMDEVSAP